MCGKLLTALTTNLSAKTVINVLSTEATIGLNTSLSTNPGTTSVSTQSLDIILSLNVNINMKMNINITIAIDCSNFTVYCQDDQELSSVPRHSMIDNTIVVDLRNNCVEYIKDDSFKGLNKLKVLLLSYNNIKNISSGAFQDQTSLNYLDLSYNGLTSVNGDMWKGLINLKSLRLTGQ